MTCCGKTKQIINKGVNIAQSYTALISGKKCKGADARVRVCRTCEYNYWIGKSLWCSLCKCYMPAKAAKKENKCPKDKWKDK